MAACKAMFDAATASRAVSLVTAMARNGVNFGIRLSGTGETLVHGARQPGRWPVFPGYSIADAAADLGD